MPNANTYLPGTIVIPGFLLISAVTQTYPLQVTIEESSENTYIPGQLLRFNIPKPYGMQQLNAQTGEILAINGVVFTMDINGTYFDPFVIPNPDTFPAPTQPATVSPAGSRNLQFTNVATQVPFQNLNNIGN